MKEIMKAAVAPLSATASIARGAAGSAAQPATTPRVSDQRFGLRFSQQSYKKNVACQKGYL